MVTFPNEAVVADEPLMFPLAVICDKVLIAPLALMFPLAVM